MKIERFWEFVLCVVLAVIKELWFAALFIFEKVGLDLAIAALSFFFVVYNKLIEVVGGVGFLHLSVRVLEMLDFVTGWFLALSVGLDFVILWSGDVLSSSGEPSLQILEFVVELHNNDTEEVTGVLVDQLFSSLLPALCL